MMTASILTRFIVGCIAAGALGITYSVADGNRHPRNEVLVAVFSSGTSPYCSDALIAPAAFVTVAHCGPRKSRVTMAFDKKHASDIALRASTHNAGLRHTGAQSDPHDLVLVAFDASSQGMMPAPLPAFGSLGQLGGDQEISATGSAGRELVIENGSGMVVQYGDNRDYAFGTLNAFNPR